MRQSRKSAVIILHGWGVRGDTYRTFRLLLEKEGFAVYAPDLPGFGVKPLPKNALTLNDYVLFVKGFVKKNIKGKYVLIGHSFGGRIAIVFSAFSQKNLRGLILTGAAGIRHPLPLRSKVAFLFAKYGASIFTVPPPSKLREFFKKLLYRFAGEFDYYRAGKLRQTFGNVIAKDLKEYLPKIKVPTLLVWGDKDRIIPVSDGYFMAKHIPRSRLVIVKDAPHRLPYTNPEALLKACLPFLRAL